ncbi:hypothetical protein [Enterobacter phage N5822]|nr:hypothetical protein [Enterobacter phage N5822]
MGYVCNSAQNRIAYFADPAFRARYATVKEMAH